MLSMHSDVVRWVKALKQAGAGDELVVRALLLLDETQPNSLSDVGAPVSVPDQVAGVACALPASVVARGYALVKMAVADGAYSNVMVPAALMGALVRRHGSVSAAYEYVRKVAERAQGPARGRSRRICELLQAELEAATLL